MRNTEPPKPGDWATFVKTRRTAARMTGAELSRRLGIDPSTLWRWETGKQRPENLDLVAAFADIFAIDLDEALAAAGMRPADVDVKPDPPLDPTVAALLRNLEDPATPAALKDYILTVMRGLVELAESQAQPPAAPPRRRKQAS